jgi:RNA-directed DNA polymerase
MTGKRSELRLNSKPARQLWLPFHVKGELFASKAESVFPDRNMQLMEAVVERENLHAALKQVVRNDGGPGIDGRTVKELPEYLKREWPEIRRQLLNGEYTPKSVKRVEIPKPGGGIRQLGIPTVVDRFIQQAVMQELQRDWDRSFSEASYGFRPNRSAHQAVLQSQQYLKQGYRWIVDIDLEKFFDRVNHDKLMSKVRERIADNRVVKLILGFLKSGIKDHDHLIETVEGTPQGGPLSPLLANLMLDQLDRELEHRGHRFVRYADDLNIYVKSRRAGKRVLKSVGNYLSSRMKLKINEAKSGVDLPWRCEFLGFSFTSKLKRRISEKSIKRFRAKVREATFRTRGIRIGKIVEELRRYLLGWQAYFNFAEACSVLKELDSWIRRRLRCYLWKQWGRGGYRELIKRGVSRDLAWNTAKSAHGPWRLSRSPGLAFALTAKHFAELGLPKLHVKPV